MDLQEIEDFIVLAECRSFSKAADFRSVTQPAFSRRIQSLETSLGVTLLDRSVTPVALTKAGERFLTYARSLAETFDKAVEDVRSQRSDLEDPVHIVMPHSLSTTFFPMWFSQGAAR